MPKAWAVDKLRPKLPLAQAAAVILRVKLPEVLHYEAQARLGEVDGIHDMRIAAKRLREAMRVLRPTLPPRERKRLLPVIEHLNDALGSVRDCDVLLEALQQLGQSDRQVKIGLKPLVADLRKQRRANHKALLHLLDDLPRLQFVERYERAMDLLQAARAPGQPTVAAFAAEAIAERLTRVIDNLDVISTPSDTVLFHRERIHVKKLKYALEPFQALFPRKLAALYQQIGDLQELMGLVHDTDVQVELLGEWEREQGDVPALTVARQMIHEQREEFLTQTAKHTQVMQKGRFDEKLWKMVAKVAGTPPAPASVQPL